MTSLFDQFKNSKSVISCWEATKQEKTISFLWKAPYGKGLVLIHNLTSIGVDRLNINVMNTTVIGVGIDAFISQVDFLSLFKNNFTSFFLPIWKDTTGTISI